MAHGQRIDVGSYHLYIGSGNAVRDSLRVNPRFAKPARMMIAIYRLSPAVLYTHGYNIISNGTSGKGVAFIDLVDFIENKINIPKATWLHFPLELPHYAV